MGTHNICFCGEIRKIHICGSKNAFSAAMMHCHRNVRKHIFLSILLLSCQYKHTSVIALLPVPALVLASIRVQVFCVLKLKSSS